MQLLLTVIMTWLSVNFGLPVAHSLPRVELVSASAMAQVRMSKVMASPPMDAGAETAKSGTPDTEAGVYAFYDNKTKTIYLPKEWTGSSPGELSILVHEMVHHLQNVEGMTFECMQAREKMAYDAQDRWLHLFGRTLEKEFALNRMTLLLRTKCMF